MLEGFDWSYADYLPNIQDSTTFWFSRLLPIFWVVAGGILAFYTIERVIAVVKYAFALPGEEPDDE